MKKTIKKLGLHVETLRNLNGPCLLEVGGGIRTINPTICTTCTNACSGCSPCF